MQPEQRQTLLGIAREVIEAVVQGQSLPRHESSQPIFAEHRGCFVTIKNRGRLRGCIGTFIADAPLLGTVEQMAEVFTKLLDGYDAFSESHKALIIGAARHFAKLIALNMLEPAAIADRSGRNDSQQLMR